jgi:hypothetical protein
VPVRASHQIMKTNKADTSVLTSLGTPPLKDTPVPISLGTAGLIPVLLADARETKSEHILFSLSQRPGVLLCEVRCFKQ